MTKGVTAVPENAVVSSVRFSRAVGCRFVPRPRATKGNKTVLAAPLLMLVTKGSAMKLQNGR